ncbi:alpha/beta fold hydrolase [Fertoebacter nigrum]|uniref:Alpha/beta fold hydrolase n=1 Tax=Fertoeibacter niger TaxID=2656921 RepID=A0A8X8GU60_9RHOB|nr:alpha/beta fold hydrolase [Fertoeibacter niger]NUB44418.1 alpha/beta fold hydrolase [Fertoeibacter niger]
MPQAEVFGHPTHWRVYGSGARQGLALHCSLAHSGEWAGVAAGLPGLSLIAPDLPGHGRSGAWVGQQDLHDLTTRIALELAGAGPVDVIGHSFGATVALRLALERPEAVRSLTLIEPVLFCAARAAGGPAYAAHQASHAPFEAAMRAGDREAAAMAFHTIWGNGQPWLAMTPLQRDYILRRIGLVAAQNPVLNDDAAGLLAPWRLEGLGLPVLLLEGGASPPVIAAIMDELARRLPMVTRAVVPGAGHMLPVTHAAEVAEAIAGHLACA